MLGLVQGKLATIGQPQVGHPSPSGIFDPRRELDTFVLELLHRRLDVVADEVDLVVAFSVRRMCGEFGRRQREDRPAASGID